MTEYPGRSHARTMTAHRSVPEIGSVEESAIVRRDPVTYAWSSLRIGLGAIFLWAFLDKLIGLGYSTTASRAWINGGNPTAGYLNSSTGPFADFFQAIAGNAITNVLFMAGLLGVGLAMILGIGVRIGGISGAAMVLMMWISHPPWAAATRQPNPVLDDHIIYAVAFVALALVHAGQTWGLGEWWARQKIVRRYAILE